MNRRGFLKRGLLGGALLTVGGGVGLHLWPAQILWRPQRDLAVFNAKTFNTMACVVARVVTVPGADPVAITHTIDAALARAAPEAQKDLTQALGLLESAAMGLVDGHLGPFSRLSPQAQDATLDAWRTSRLSLRRGAYKALKNLAVTSYYRFPSAWPAAGYAGPPAHVEALRQAQLAQAEGTPP